MPKRSPQELHGPAGVGEQHSLPGHSPAQRWAALAVPLSQRHLSAAAGPAAPEPEHGSAAAFCLSGVLLEGVCPALCFTPFPIPFWVRNSWSFYLPPTHFFWIKLPELNANYSLFALRRIIVTFSEE